MASRDVQVPKTLTHLDFSKTQFRTRDELKAALWKVPDLKLRYDRFWDEEVLCKMKNTCYPFPNPVPSSLRSVRLVDLSQVEIDWRMMTLLRPNTKLEEDIFTRLVQMERFRSKMSKSAKSLMPPLRGPPRSGFSGVSSRSKGGPVAEDDSTDEVVSEAAQLDSSTYDYYVRDIWVDEDQDIDADLIKNGVALPSTQHSKEERKDHHRRRRVASESKKKELPAEVDGYKEGQTPNDKTRRKGKRKTKRKEDGNGGSNEVKEHVHKWVEDSARQVLDEKEGQTAGNDVTDKEKLRKGNGRRKSKKNGQVKPALENA